MTTPASEDLHAGRLEPGDGYLLPYRRQFVVVEREYVKILGLDPEDPAWEAVGHDLAQPADLAAYRELVAARLTHARA